MTRGLGAGLRWPTAAAAVACAAGLGAFAGEQVLPLVLEDPVSGRRVTIEAGARATHLVLFATWCQPCLEEFRGLADLETKWGERGYRVILVAVPARQTSDRLSRFVSEQHPPGRVLFDSRGALTRSAGADEVPTHLLLDRQGKVVLRSARLDARLAAEVERLLAPASGRR